MPRGESGQTVNAKNRRATAKGNPTSLPAPITGLIGRRSEIARVERLLAASRLVTLTGPGGCGKTSLALAVAYQLVSIPTFDNGIWWIDLAGVDTPVLILQVVATALGIPEISGRPFLEMLTDFIQDKKVLFVLDNCEHLLPAGASSVQMLLEHCPQLRILATSREPLGIAEEMMWLVPSLTLPERNQRPGSAQWKKSEAIQLFVARAKTALPDFALNDANAPAVEQICRRLDGIPLAIELAAARIKMLDVAQIAARLEDSLQLLTRGSQNAPPRHQTMRAAFDWSYALLHPREQKLFQRLAVFADGFALEAAEVVCADYNLDISPHLLIRSSDVLDLLTDLVDKSLVLVAEREPEQAVRYRLLEPARQYALEQLRAADGESITRDRHLSYFVVLAEDSERQLKSANQLVWMTLLEKENENLRAALSWGTQTVSRSVTGLRIAKAMHLFWQRRGYWSEGRRWLSLAIENSQADANTQSAETLGYLARALVARSWLALYEMAYADAPADLERGLVLAESCGDVTTMAFAQGLVALLKGYTGDKPASHRYALASAETAQRANDRWALAWALYIVGWNAFFHQHDLEAARAALDESERLFRAAGDKRSIAVNATLRGIMALDENALGTARAHYEEALAIGRELNDVDLQVKELTNLAFLNLVQRNTAEAKELFEQAIVQRLEWNSSYWIAGCMFGLGQAYIFEGDLDAAEDQLRQALTVILREQRKPALALIMSAFCRILAARGRAIHAAQGLGFIEANLQISARTLVADDRILLQENILAVRDAISPEEFNHAFADGRALILEQAVQLLLHAEQAANVQVVPDTPTTESLNLSALGTTRVSRGAQAVSDWHYARVKELLFYLASHPARTKAEIGLALWPDSSPSQLRNSLGTCFYYLRRALGNPEWIVFEKDHYQFNRALPYGFDVEVFEANLIQASTLRAQSPERAATLLQQTLVLYQGDFVQDFLEGEWFLLRREELRRKYLDAWLALGRLHFAQQDYSAAADAFRRAIEKDNMLEEGHRELMRSYARAGERGLALRQYQSLEQVMRDELGSLPAPESLALFERLRRGENV